MISQSHTCWRHKRSMIIKRFLCVFASLREIFKHIITFFLIILSLFVISCNKTKTSYYDNGKLKSEISMKGEKYHGTSTWYYSNGLKQHECNYINDTLQGRSTRWFVNGKTHSVEYYKDNHLNGTVTTFDLNGKKVSEENYHLNTLHGPFFQYYTSGQIQIQGNYNKGMYNGQWLYYEDDGTIVGIGEYKDGAGKQRAWYRNGPLKRVVNYLDNEKHGKEIWYKPDGSPEKYLVYDHGELIPDL